MPNFIKKDNYYNHIDGLRAVAVVAVIVFHANSDWLSGGFIGVDIFFVISGFLISKILFEQFSTDNFSLWDFYIRRLRRIYPALILVITLSFLADWFTLLPDEMRKFSESIFSSMLMFSNKQFLAEAGYFDTQSNLKPLLHTWSLSIEAQFYLIFPIVFFLIVRFSNKPLVWFVCLMFISLFYAERVSQIDSEKSFFFFQTRVWEFLSGTITYFILKERNSSSSIVNQFASLLGIGLICYSLIFFQKGMVHPGIKASIAIIGASLIIIFAKYDTFAGKLLTSRPIVGVGVISYSLYLFHHPFFAFLKIYFSTPNHLTFLISLIVLFTISYLSWRLIEQPFRSKKIISNRLFIGLIVISLVGLCVISLIGYKTNGFIKERYTEEQARLLKSLDADNYKSFLFKNLLINEIGFKKYEQNSKPRMLIVGDSYAADFMNMIENNHYLQGYQIRTLYIPARCQFYLGDTKYQDHIDSKDLKLCRFSQRKLNYLKQNINEFDEIIFVFQWQLWAVSHLKESIAELKIKSDKRLIFIGSKGFEFNRRAMLKAKSSNITQLITPSSDRVRSVNQIIARNSTPHIFIDQNLFLCPNQMCSLFTPESSPISIDGQHLTNDGATYLGKKLFSNDVLFNLNIKNKS